MIELLKYKIIHFENFSLSVYHLLQLLVMYVIVQIVLIVFKKSLVRSQRLDVGQKFSIYQIVKYIIYILYGIFAAGVVGLNLSLLLASSAALLVGIGFGLQHLFKDIVSGLVILFDRTIKVNDVIEMDNIVSKVLKINLRTTTVLTREDKYIVIPNSVILESKVINWTLSQITSRFEIPLTVAYKSDVKAVMQLLKDTAAKVPGVNAEPPTSVRFNNFGDSGIEFLVFFYTDDVFRVENLKSHIRVALFDALKKQGVEIPYPHVQLKTDSKG